METQFQDSQNIFWDSEHFVGEWQEGIKNCFSPAICDATRNNNGWENEGHTQLWLIHQMEKVEKFPRKIDAIHQAPEDDFSLPESK